MKNQLNLGELIALLEKEPQDNMCSFDFCDLLPAGFSSYRGYYEQLAMGWRIRTFDDGDSPFVVEVLRMCRSAIGEAYTGYKGGEYKMGLSTPLWVSNPGYASGTAIVGLVDCDYMTVIETRHL